MIRKIITIFVCAVLLSCNEDGMDGNNSLIDIIKEPKGENCSSGGYKITTGLDINSNNILDEDEIQNTEYICNGDDGGYDKEIRIAIPGFLGQNDNNPSYSDVRIRDFDLRNYSSIDSVVFVAYDILTTSGCCGAPDVSSQLKVELFDITNDTVIENSFIISDDTNGNPIQSQNLISTFPKEKIDIGLKLTYETGTYSQAYGLYLILYRK